jgi:AsmA protein
VAAAFGAFGLMTLLLSAETVREAVKAEIRTVTGLSPILRGDASVSLFPSGRVSFDDVSLGDARSAAPALTAEQVVARLRFFPLLIGRIEIADVSLVRPTITIAFNSDRSSNWSSHIETLARTLQPSSTRVTSFSEIRIEDATFIMRDEAFKIVEVLSHVKFALAWPSISNSFAATGRLSWNGEAIEASISFTDFVAALRGERSGLKVRLAGAPFNFAFDGYISHRPTLRMEGSLAANAVSLRETLRWAGQKPPPGGGFGHFALKAQTNVVGGTIGLSNVNVELDGNSGEGVLTFANDGRQTMQGTLAAEGLDLTPYVSAIRLLTSTERGWDRRPISLEGLTGLDVDLRLSAARVSVGNAKLGRTAVTVGVRNGNLTVGIAESQAFGGMARGTFGLAKSQAGTDFKAQMQFADIELEQCLGELFGIRRLEGKGNLNFAIDSSGESVFDLTTALNGTANLASSKGAISGFNVELLLKRLERNPLSRGGEFRSGKTPYDTLTVGLKMAQGLATIEEVRMEGPTVRLIVTGSAQIPTRELDLKGLASLLSSAANSSDSATVSFELPFIVGGPWDDPFILPDPKSRLDRSGAAAPLRDAIRNLGASDVVRSVIERLTGAQRGTAAPPAESAAEPEETTNPAEAAQVAAPPPAAAPAITEPAAKEKAPQ